MGAARPRKLTTLLAQLRAAGVREYEEGPDGAVRLVFDERAPEADAKKKKPDGARPNAAVIALHGFPPDVG